jgi:hypothetical protein
MLMLSLPGALLFLTDHIAISVSNIPDGSFSTSCLVSVSLVCAVLWEVLRSAFVVFGRS